MTGSKMKHLGISRLAGIVLLAALVAVLLLFASSAARSQPALCAERAVVLAHLEQRFHEERTAFGVTADGRLLEVFAGPLGSWTILVTAPGGPTCLVRSGSGWREIETRGDEPFA